MTLLLLGLACLGAAPEPRPPADASPAAVPSEPEPAEEASPLPALNEEVPPELGCEVELIGVAEDASYRGRRETPATQSAREGMSPEEQQLWDAESHAASYRLCRYTLSVKGAPYALTLSWDTTLQELPEGWCQRAAEHAVAEAQRVSRGCTQLDAGAWYGLALTPLEPE